MVTEERAEYLGGGISIYINPDHRFGTDALLLADFASPTKRDFACDLGTGCGIIPFLWARENKPEHCYGVEIDPDACKMAGRSVEQCNLEGRISIINADLREVLPIANGSLSLVTCNPPYFTNGSGEHSANHVRGRARHELSCDINDVAKCASKLLKFSGRLCVCQRPDRLVDTISAMKNVGIEPKRIRIVSKRVDSQPWLILVEGKKGAKSGMVIEPLFNIQNNDGEYSEKMRKIYKMYREEIG